MRQHVCGNGFRPHLFRDRGNHRIGNRCKGEVRLEATETSSIRTEPNPEFHSLARPGRLGGGIKEYVRTDRLVDAGGIGTQADGEISVPHLHLDRSGCHVDARYSVRLGTRIHNPSGIPALPVVPNGLAPAVHQRENELPRAIEWKSIVQHPSLIIKDRWHTRSGWLGHQRRRCGNHPESNKQGSNCKIHAFNNSGTVATLHAPIRLARIHDKEIWD